MGGKYLRSANDEHLERDRWGDLKEFIEMLVFYLKRLATLSRNSDSINYF